MKISPLQRLGLNKEQLLPTQTKMHAARSFSTLGSPNSKISPSSKNSPADAKEYQNIIIIGALVCLQAHVSNAVN